MKSVIHAITTAAGSLLRNWSSAFAFVTVYVALLATLYLFFVTREASVWQVLLTLALPLIASVLFFVFQTMSVSYAQSGTNTGRLVRRSAVDFWKLMVISLPVIGLGWLVVYLLSKVQVDLRAVASEAARTASAPARTAARSAAQPTDWRHVALTGFQYLALCLVLPLAAIHLWIAVARQGLMGALKGAGRTLAHSFGPKPVLTYAVGVLVFGVVPYFLVVTRTPAMQWWVEIALLATRLALAFGLALFGWVITVGALAELSSKAAESKSPGEQPAAAK